MGREDPRLDRTGQLSFCGKCGAEQERHVKVGPGRYRAVGSVGMAEPNCPECLRLLNELCRVNFELGKADGRHAMLRVAARSLLEWAKEATNADALALGLAALQEALEAIE